MLTTGAARRYEELFGSRQNLQVADIYECIANMHGRNEKFDEAFVLFETALEIRMNLLGIDHAKVGQTLLSHCY